MSYTFTINGATTVDIPVTRDLTGYTLKLVLDKGGSAAPVEVTSGLVAGAGKVTLTIPANNLNTFTETDYALFGTKNGVTTRMQTGRIEYATATGSQSSQVTVTNPVNTVTVANPVNNVGVTGPVTIETSPTSNGVLTKTIQEKFRHEFTGNTIDTNFWDVTTGAGMTVSVTNSVLTIASGTTVNSTTILRSKKTWSGAYRVMFVAAASLMNQRIANHEVELRVTNAARTSYASWVFAGTTATSGIVRAYNNGLTTGDQVQNAIPTTAGLGVFEIENFVDEVYYHTRLPDSANPRASTNVRNRMTPDPNEEMYVEIVVRNGSTAPALSTNLTLDAVLIQDISELTTEITGGRGGGGGSQAIPVQTVNTVNVNANNSNVLPSIGVAEATPISTTAIAANGTSQQNIDHGTSITARPTRLRPVVMHNAGQTHGYLILQESADNTTYRETWRTPVPSDGLYHTFDIPVHMRYNRLIFQNGAVAQTGFFFSYTSFRGDSIADVQKNLSFPLTPATGSPVAASAYFFGTTIDLGANHNWDRARFVAFLDQAGGIYIDESMDGTTWFVIGSGVNVGAGGAARLEQQITTRYVRFRFYAGATALTAARLIGSLVTL